MPRISFVKGRKVLLVLFPVVREFFWLAFDDRSSALPKIKWANLSVSFSSANFCSAHWWAELYRAFSPEARRCRVTAAHAAV